MNYSIYYKNKEDHLIGISEWGKRPLSLAQAEAIYDLLKEHFMPIIFYEGLHATKYWNGFSDSKNNLTAYHNIFPEKYEDGGKWLTRYI